MREILADLVAEEQSLDQFLQTLNDRDWRKPSLAAGWDVRAVVSHLAALESFAAALIEERASSIDPPIEDLDAWIAEGVARGRSKRYQEVLEWWRSGRARVVDALSRVEPGYRVPWVLGSMSARSFATLRLMETWAHGLDIRGAFPDRVDPEEEQEVDTPRLRHVAWLAHRMLPWAFEQAGEAFPDQGIRVELMGPRYARWVYGPADTDQVIKGIAGEWCRVAVRRLDAADSGLKAIGEHAEVALRVVRAY
jgi:uncharacterized protein (TIGR03084 family)